MPKSILVDPKQVALIRAARAKQMAAQQTMAAAGAASQIGKNMSDIDVGGGQNAVSLMTGLGGAGGLGAAPPAGNA